MDWESFCNNLKEILELERCKNKEYINCEIDKTKILIEYYFEQDKLVQFTYTKRKFLNDYKGVTKQEELGIYNDTYYEIPISFKNRHLPVMLRYDPVTKKEYIDNENNLKYAIDNPSEQFWLKMVELKIRSNVIMPLRRLAIFERDFKFKNGIDKKSIFDLLRMVYRDCITLKIYSINKYKKTEFQDLANALIFNINYNTDMGVRQTYDMEEIYEKRRSSRFRHESIEEVNAPKSIYKKELIEQYNMASISEDPFIKYLCYYHILEHFYESVYKEDLINAVREKLKSPSFSIKKENEILKLIETISEKTKYNRENFEGNELKSLELVIKKYVDINTVKSKIKDSINSELLDYYNTKEVKFSKGIPINFNDIDNIQSNIAKRIYYTRNALVHYKSNDFAKKEKGIYRPFKDKEELLNEIPLIRVLAEEVIIKDSDIF